jgi:CheY-like chemotaxis protein
MRVDKVLVIDDDEDILRSLAREFAQEKCQVLTTTNPDMALSWMAQHPIAVVVSDYRMPRMNGVELLEQVRLVYPDIFRVLLTGYGDFEIAMGCINRGHIHRFMTKPWEKDELLVAIKQGLEFGHLIEMREQILKNRVLTEMAGAAAHEINQPLQILMGVCDLLDMKLGPDSNIRTYLDSMQDAAARISGIVQKMQKIQHYVATHYIHQKNIIDMDSASGSVAAFESSIRCLLVGIDAGLRSLVASQAEVLKCSVSFAGDCAAAIELLSGSGGEFDCVIVGRGDAATAARLREQDEIMQIILVANHVDQELMQQVQNLSRCHVVPKYSLRENLREIFTQVDGRRS